MRKNTILPAEQTNDTDAMDESGERDDPASFYDGPSKSQLKREAEALQKLGGELVELSAERLKKIDMPDNLREAIRDAQRISANGAKRRQAQLIGKIMRSVDIEPIQAALDEINGVSVAATQRLHRLETLRSKLLADEKFLTELIREFPTADAQQLRQLRRNALREGEQSKPPRAYRELFKVLRELVESGSAVDAGGTATDDEGEADAG